MFVRCWLVGPQFDELMRCAVQCFQLLSHSFPAARLIQSSPGGRAKTSGKPSMASMLLDLLERILAHQKGCSHRLPEYIMRLVM